MLYQINKVNTITKKGGKKYGISKKNIEAAEKWDQRKEEPENEIRKNKL